ncbi:MAG TPA: polyprenyl synthetase family protein [Thermomicrobiales bacterium]|nr:polyprenyl synthetase family protein [Thermomicrobiales bacterium]
MERRILLASLPLASSISAALDGEMLATLAEAERAAPPPRAGALSVYDIMRYHLGFVDASFQPARSDPGKRIRPLLCMLTNEAAGGDPADAMPMAAGIELLHNFTLIHDDIQDHSPLRRHRPTAWSIWGVAQAINAGDAMFAVAHLALLRSARAGMPAGRVLALTESLHRTTLRIVEGQVLDLGFESRSDVTADEYMVMIGGKSAEICRCACWAGATIAGASDDRAQMAGDAGFALGIGFQLRDDILGIWGDTAQTGKVRADDIRRRKKSLPILLLRDRATPVELAELDALYAQSEVAPDGVERILTLLREYDVESAVQTRAQIWHDQALELLQSSLPESDARVKLEALVDALVARAG